MSAVAGLLMVASAVVLPAGAGKSLAQEDCSGEGAANPLPGAYLLLIDHSGSMRLSATNREGELPADGELSRWEAMTQRAKAFIDSVPAGSYVWIAVFDEDPDQAKNSAFSKTIASAEDRAEAKKHLDNISEPDESGFTALFETQHRALDVVTERPGDSKTMYVTVLVYSDGGNTVIVDEEGNIEKLLTTEDLRAKNPPQRKKLEDRLAAMEEEFPHLTRQIFDLDPRNDAQSRGIPLPVRMTPKDGSTTLGNPKLAPEQTLPLVFCYWEDMAKHLDGQPLSFEFESTGEPIDVEIEGKYQLRRGVVEVKLKVRNPQSLKNVKYTGRVRVKYPAAVDGYELVAEGGDAVDVSFVKGDRVEVSDVRPGPDSVFALGQAIRFSVATLADSKISWYDGAVRIGDQAEFVHDFKATGKHEITLDVQRDGYLPLQQPISFTVNVIDLKVAVNPLAKWPLAERPVSIACRVDGDAAEAGKIARYEWIVNGMREPQAGDGNSMEHAFLRPGEHEVRVRAVHPQMTVESSPFSVKVFRVPTLSWNGPPQAPGLMMGEPLVFRANIQSAEALEGVRWRVETPDGDVLEEGAEGSINSDGPRSFSEFAFTLPEDAKWLAAGQDELEVNVTAVGTVVDDIVEVEAPRVAAQFTARAPPRSVRLIADSPGAKYVYGKPISIKAHVAGPKVEQVAWTIWKGMLPNMEKVKEATVNVAPDTGVSILQHEFNEATTGDQPITVTAAAVLPADYKTTAPGDTLTLSPAPFSPALLLANAPEDGEYHVGDTVTLQLDNPSGHSIVGVDWDFGDGVTKEGKETQVSHQYSQPRSGDTPYRVKAVVRTASRPAPLEVTTPVNVIPSPHLVYTLMLLPVALVAGYFVARRFSGNGPRAWTLYVSDDPYKFPPYPSAKVADHWSRADKQAIIPMADLMKRHARHDDVYWTKGDGRREHIEVSAVGTGKQTHGVVKFSAKGDPAVTFEMQGDTRNTRTWELIDDRAPDGDRLRHVYIQLKEDQPSHTLDRLVIAATCLVLLLAVALTFHFTYLSRL